MAKTATLQIRVEEDLKNRLKEIADREDRTLSYVAEQAIKDRVAFEQAQIRGIERALTQADRGELVAGGDARKWIESWGTETELPMPEPKPKV